MPAAGVAVTVPGQCSTAVMGGVKAADEQICAYHSRYGVSGRLMQGSFPAPDALCAFPALSSSSP